MVSWGRKVFAPRWRLVPFQPILSVFAFLGTLHVIFTDNAPIDNMDHVIGWGGYSAWLILALSSPPLLVVAWWLVLRSHGHARYLGLWIRLSADIAQGSALLAFLMSMVKAGRATGNDWRVFSFFILCCVTVFCAALVVRDVWTIMLTQQVAARIRRRRG